MKIFFPTFVFGFLVFLFQASVGATTVAPDDPAVITMGRFTADHQFGWTASGARLGFHGTSASLLLETTKGRKAALQVVVDGQPTEVLLVTPGQKVYPLTGELPAGDHTVEVWKRSEGFAGQLKFLGFELNEGGKTLPAKASQRRMMVIGDSISCGYGNEAKQIKEGNSVENENGYMAYGPIAARELDAELMMVCWSGRGLYRNRSMENDTEGVLPELFEQTLPQEKEPAWDHGSFSPEVIVINLGTNDLARGGKGGGEKPELTKENFLGAYRAFAERLLTLYPKARIIASIGPMATAPIDGWLNELAAENPQIDVLVFEPKKGAEYLGGNWHPSVAMDIIMAETLVQKIRQITGWE